MKRRDVGQESPLRVPLGRLLGGDTTIASALIDDSFVGILRAKRIVVEELAAFGERALERLTWQRLTRINFSLPK